MYRARDYWDNFRGSDPVTQMIAGAAFAILLVIALPRIWPGASNGVSCENLSIPRISGNNQSILGLEAGSDDLVLELIPAKTIVAIGEPLQMDVRFINLSMRPLTLYMGQDIIPFRYTEQEVGLQFSIQSEDGRVLGEPPNVRPFAPVPGQYTANQLRVVGPRQRCTKHVEVDSARLTVVGMTGGRYRISAIYLNRTRGALPPVQQRTPTPIFADQGVWVGQVPSNEVIITVGGAPPAPAQ
jgi:hypothetical protein